MISLSSQVFQSSDGASVMTGKLNGVAAKLRSEIKSLINVHCICHRLALAGADACDSVTYLQQVEKILYQLWSFFRQFSKEVSSLCKSCAKSEVVESLSTREKEEENKNSKGMQNSLVVN